MPARKTEKKATLPKTMVTAKATRGVELESVDDLDERQVAAWMEQITAVSSVGGKK